MIDFLTALFLGFIEGLTEFIPVSSTAHLVILTDVMNFQTPPGHVFEVFIQIGAIMAVVVLYRHRFWGTLVNFPRDASARRFAFNLIVGTIPALVAGYLGHDWIKGHLYTPPVIAATLVGGGIAILFLEKRLTRTTIDSVDDISLRTAFLIGCCQTLALVPGVSRSGATIMGSLAFGLARSAAAEFSFFLAVPVMLAAVTYDTARNWDAIAAYGHFGLMATGLVSAFLTALVVIKFALRIIGSRGFAPFAWYRIAIGGVIVLTLVL